MRCPKCHATNHDTQRFCGDCGTQIPSPKKISPSLTKTLETPKQELVTGSIFADKYQVIEELGQGGMGKVYKALDAEVNEKVAIKLVKPEISADKKFIERFRNELKFTRKIRHKNVCQMYDLNQKEGTYYITMEYVPGEDLKSFIRKSRQLALGTTLTIAKQVCEGLTEAHKLGIVHRDLKPGNIMVDKDGNVRLMDFGIARFLEAKGITGDGVMIGTPEYMSPEQVEGEEVDQRSDIYSLGIILYEMLTERLPFEGNTPFTIGVKHKSEVPKNPREFNPQISEDLSHVILKCLEKKRENRYQNASEVRSELERIEQELPSSGHHIPKKRPDTSKEITLTFDKKKLLVPVFISIMIVIIGVIVWRLIFSRDVAPVLQKKPSIAVLPFKDLSPQQDQAYICDGIAAELINRLTKIEKLNVPAQASSFSFKGKSLDVHEIGNKLNVDSVLAGSLQKAKNRLRITVELVKVSDGYPIWSEKYERNMEDIFALQDEISLSIVDNLKIKLLGEEKAELVTRQTQNLEAYNMFLKGRHFWAKRTEEDLRKAIDYFEQSIELDPNYALAYAALADSYSLLPFYTYTLPQEAFTKAKSAVIKALDIDETLAEAHSALGFIKMYYDWDWKAAETELKRAIQIKPSYVTAHHWYAEYLSWVGRHEEAIDEIRRAFELDPLSLLINYIKAFLIFYAGQYDKAIEQCQKTLELDPNYLIAYSTLAKAYLEKGMYEDAITAIKKRGYRMDLGYAYALAGKREESLEILEEMKERWNQGDFHALPIARVYVCLGEENLAFEWLEKSLARREPNMVKLKVNPFFDSLRSHPRFKALLKKMALN